MINNFCFAHLVTVCWTGFRSFLLKFFSMQFEFYANKNENHNDSGRPKMQTTQRRVTKTTAMIVCVCMCVCTTGRHTHKQPTLRRNENLALECISPPLRLPIWPSQWRFSPFLLLLFNPLPNPQVYKNTAASASEVSAPFLFLLPLSTASDDRLRHHSVRTAIFLNVPFSLTGNTSRLLVRRQHKQPKSAREINALQT